MYCRIWICICKNVLLFALVEESTSYPELSGVIPVNNSPHFPSLSKYLAVIFLTKDIFSQPNFFDQSFNQFFQIAFNFPTFLLQAT